jgi:CRISPR-associated protein Csm5
MAVLKFRVDTPLFVLGGGSVLVGLDAFYRDGYLYLVDITSPRLVAAAAARPSLKEVIGLASSRPAEYAYRRLPSPPVPEKTEVKLGVVPPASTVKGLLRTAYLWLALTRDEKLAEAFLRAVAEALEEGAHPKFVGSEGEALVFKRELKGGRRWDAFNSVMVRERGAEARFCVYRVDVYERASVKTSFYAVGLEPGSRLEYEVAVRPRPREGGGAEYVMTEEELREALRLFSRELAAFERARGLYVPQCDAVRLGFGAGRRWKTVLSLIDRRSPDLFRGLESYMTQRLGRFWGDATVKVAEGRPVGWACYEWG